LKTKDPEGILVLREIDENVTRGICHLLGQKQFELQQFYGDKASSKDFGKGVEVM